MGVFAVFVTRQAPTLAVDGYTLSDVQQAVAQQVLGIPAAVEITGVVAEL